MNNLSRTKSQLKTREAIEVLESELRAGIDAGEIEQTIVDCKEDNTQANHYFGEGVYCRSLLCGRFTLLIYS